MALIPRIKQQREKAKLLQYELAKKLNISKGYMSELEKGTHYPGVELAFYIAYHCNCLVDDLYELEQPDNKSLSSNTEL